MAKQVISTPEVYESADYSQAVRAGNTVYVAGTTGVDVSTGDFAGPTADVQTRQALLNCQTILRAAGAELSDTVMIHALIARSDDAGPVGSVINEFWPEVRPARCVSRIGVDRPGLLVSIALTAVID